MTVDWGTPTQSNGNGNGIASNQQGIKQPPHRVSGRQDDSGRQDHSHSEGTSMACGNSPTPETTEVEQQISEHIVDLPAIEAAVRTILTAVGEDPNRSGLLDTPRRVAKMYQEMFAGLHKDPSRHLKVTFPVEYDEMVLVRDIEFTSMCEHHLLPFSGVAHVAYIPHGCVTGLSKLARVVEEVSRRPQVQERMTHQIAELVEHELQSAGVAVVIRAEHSCMSIRGVRKPGSSTVTSALRGQFKTNQSSRAEVLSLINNMD